MYTYTFILYTYSTVYEPKKYVVKSIFDIFFATEHFDRIVIKNEKTTIIIFCMRTLFIWKTSIYMRIIQNCLQNDKIRDGKYEEAIVAYMISLSTRRQINYIILNIFTIINYIFSLPPHKICNEQNLRRKFNLSARRTKPLVCYPISYRAPPSLSRQRIDTTAYISRIRLPFALFTFFPSSSLFRDTHKAHAAAAARRAVASLSQN